MEHLRDFSHPSDKDAALLDGYSYESLLMELNCNLQRHDTTPEKVMAHFESVIASRLGDARHLLELNMNRIIVHARSRFDTVIDLVEVEDGLEIHLIDREEFRLRFTGSYFTSFEVLEIAGLIGNDWHDATDNFDGALTSSPIILKGGELDEETGRYVDAEAVYWFPAYETVDPWQVLEDEGMVKFTKA